MTRSLVALFLLFLITSCAQQVAPNGGPKDIEAPQIVGSEPTNFSINQKPEKITLGFDEFVTQRNLNSELLISPPLKERPKFYFKGKSFVLEIDEELESNTTYTINFGQGLIDLNEGNLLDSNLIVFSTGSFLDSGSISGKLVDAQSLKPLKDIWVMLYNSLDDSIFCKEKPSYYTRTSKNGRFNIDYLKPGKYQVFGLEDQNSNYKFDLPNEKIAMVKRPITIGIDTAVTLNLFEEDNQKQFLKSISIVNENHFKVILNLPSNKVTLDVIGKFYKIPWFKSYQTTPNDTIDYFISDPFGVDTLGFLVLDNDEILDTTTVILSLDTLHKLKTLKKAPNSIAYFKAFNLVFNLPVLNLDTSFVELWQDSIMIESNMSLGSKNTDQLKIENSWEQESEYTLKIFPNALKSFNNLTTDTLIQKFKIIGEDGFTNVIVALDSNEYSGSIIYQILKGKEDVLHQTISSEKQVTFKDVKLGTYRVKLIYDIDSSGDWTTGKFGSKQLPEEIFIYKDPVVLKPGFDTQVKWNFSKSTVDE